MSKCSKCPFNSYSFEEYCDDCDLDLMYEIPIVLWNMNKCRCRIPLFVLKIIHKRYMKAEADNWAEYYERTKEK